MVSQSSPHRSANFVDTPGLLDSAIVIMHESWCEWPPQPIDEKQSTRGAIDSNSTDGLGRQIHESDATCSGNGRPPVLGVLFVPRTVPSAAELLRVRGKHFTS